MPETTEFLEWFRVDRSRGTWWLLGLGTLFVFLGAGLVASGILTHGSAIWHAMTLPGSVLLVVGLVIAFGGMTVLLAQDEYLAIRPDGILVHRTRGDVVLAWNYVTAIKHDAAIGVLVFETKDEPPYRLGERYSGVTGGELAAHLDDLRRKAAQGPLDYLQVGRIALGLPHRRPK